MKIGSSWKGPAWSVAEERIIPGESAYERVIAAANEINLYINNDDLERLYALPGEAVRWVSENFYDAQKYGTPMEADCRGEIIGTDKNGGYLVLLDEVGSNPEEVTASVAPVLEEEREIENNPYKENYQAQAIAQRYVLDNGLPPIQYLPYVQVDPVVGDQIADFFQNMPDSPNDPAVREAYAALIDETAKQFAVLPVEIIPVDSASYPYKNSQEMMDDVMDNGQLAVFDGGDDHSIFSRKQNFMFRAVHDFFGHAQHGFAFGPRGEENAWLEHSKMFTPLARKALTMETRFQNQWVNRGPYSKLPVTERPYAAQKVGDPPAEFVTHPAFEAAYAMYPEFLVRSSASNPNTTLFLKGFEPEEKRKDYTLKAIKFSNKTYAKVREYFNAGQSGLNWYEETPLRVMEFFNGDRQRTNLFIGFLAATSPLRNIWRNTELALRALMQYDKCHRNGDDYSRCFVLDMPNHRSGALSVALGLPFNEKTSPKVSAFFRNLTEPYEQDSGAVTVDTWMLRAFGLRGAHAKEEDKKGAPSTAEYKAVKKAVQALAAEAGVLPRQYQAAVWVGIKLLEGSPLDTTSPFETALFHQLENEARQDVFDFAAEDQLAEVRDRRRALGELRDRRAREWEEFGPLTEEFGRRVGATVERASAASYNPYDFEREVWSNGVEEFLRSQGASEDVISYVANADEEVQGKLANAVRKSPLMTIEALQSFEAELPRKKRVPTEREENVANNPNWSKAVQKWLLIQILKARIGEDKDKAIYSTAKQGPYYWYSLPPFERAPFDSAFIGMVRNTVDEINDWVEAENIDLHLYNWTEAVEATREWHESCALGDRDGDYEPLREEDIELELENGWKIVKITNEHDMTTEGNLMGHCVGGGGYWRKYEEGRCLIFSLRDKKNEPHATVEIGGPNLQEVVQIQGKENNEPIQKYKDMLREWFEGSSYYKKYGEERSVINDMYEEAGYGEVSNSVWNLISYLQNGAETFDTDQDYGFGLIESYDDREEPKELLQELKHIFDPKSSGYEKKIERFNAEEAKNFAGALLALANFQTEQDKDKTPRTLVRLLVDAADEMTSVFGTHAHYVLELYATPEFRKVYDSTDSGYQSAREKGIQGLSGRDPDSKYMDEFEKDTGWKADEYDTDRENYLDAYTNWALEELIPNTPLLKASWEVLEQFGLPFPAELTMGKYEDVPGQLRLKDEEGMTFNPNAQTPGGA